MTTKLFTNRKIYDIIELLVRVLRPINQKRGTVFYQYLFSMPFHSVKYLYIFYALTPNTEKSITPNSVFRGFFTLSLAYLHLYVSKVL